MRGRIWACWIVMSLEGVFCMLMASVTLSMDAPFDRQLTQGWTRIDTTTCSGFYHEHEHHEHHENATTNRNRYNKEYDAWCPVNDTQVSECGCVHQALSVHDQELYGVGDDLRMICEPAWNRDGAAINCIKNQEHALGLAVFCLICFSICVQAAYHTRTACGAANTHWQQHNTMSCMCIRERPRPRPLAVFLHDHMYMQNGCMCRRPRGCTMASCRTSRAPRSASSPAWSALATHLLFAYYCSTPPVPPAPPPPPPPPPPSPPPPPPP